VRINKHRGTGYLLNESNRKIYRRKPLKISYRLVLNLGLGSDIYDEV
jgi:hypothetical protein